MIPESRIVVVGANGQLGLALQERLPGAVALDRAALDVSDEAAVQAYDWSGVEAIVNAAGWTDVDGAEDPAKLDAVRAANVDAVAHLAAAAERAGATLVHVSSEYVFDGTHPGPMPEDLTPSPLSVYGRSKADGDEVAASVDRHYIVRTTWVVGEGRNFVRTMAGLADGGVSPRVVDDQIGRLTFAADLAAGIVHLLDVGPDFGTYNLTSDGDPVSWAQVASAVFAVCGRSAADVRGISTRDYLADKPDSAHRPLNSVLDLEKIIATGFSPPGWRDVIPRFLDRPERRSSPRHPSLS